MHLLVIGLTTVALAFAFTPTALAQTPLNGEECGRVNAFTAATASTDGSLTLGTRSFVLPADPLYSQMGQNRLSFVVGNAICVAGTSVPRVQYIAGAVPDPYCGTVIAAQPGSLTIHDLGDATFRVPPGFALGTAAAGQRICVRLSFDAAGDPFVAARILTIAERTVARVNWCGLVSAWTRPTADNAGSITIGTRTFAIAAGTPYSTVNAAPVVGQPTCLGGALDGNGSLIEYAAQPGLPTCLGGVIDRYVAPTATNAGEVHFAVSSPTTYTDFSHRFPIPAGTTLPANANDGAHCFTLALAPSGNVIVAGAQLPPQGGLVARGPTTLPNTGTAAAADDIVCGRIMGLLGATATAPGSLVVAQPGRDVAPAGTYMLIPQGMTQVTAQGSLWVCIRTTPSAPTPVMGGMVATRTFAGFVPPGTPGFQAEPAAPSPSGPLPSGRGGVGVLPGTSTAPNGSPPVHLALVGSGILVLCAIALRRLSGDR